MLYAVVSDVLRLQELVLCKSINERSRLKSQGFRGHPTGYFLVDFSGKFALKLHPREALVLLVAS